MRILQLHSEFIEYEPVLKEIELSDDVKPERLRLEDVVVIFVSVEEQDDESFAQRAIDEVRESLQRLGANRILIYPYSHLSNRLAEPSRALKVVRAMEDYAEKLGIETYRAPFGWTKAFNIKVKGHPLAEQYKLITHPQEQATELVSQALKAEEKLVSSWFILELDGKLTPVDKFDFAPYPNLEKLARYEMTKARAEQQVPPHTILMKRLGIADYESGSDLGNLRFYPKGRLMKSLLERYISEVMREYGALEVETPVMYDFRHPSLSDYLHRFPARQYIVRSEGKELFLRFSACFGQFLMVKDAQLSYKHLPLKVYELTRYSFRREKSGELAGLRRLRAFTMPDCHALCADMEQVRQEVPKRFELSMKTMKGIGLSEEDYELVVRFTEDFYQNNRDLVLSLVKMIGKPALVEMWSEKFFYFVFKWEFNFIDNLGKASALSTDQIDVENAQRYEITYVDEKGEKRYPIILHNSPSGAIERCIYALLEKAHKAQKEGKAPSLPLWLSSTQVRIVPVSEEFMEKAKELLETLKKNRIRADIDDRDETIQKKVRGAEREWVRFILVIGRKEVESGILQVRDREAREIKTMKLHELIELIKKETEGRPFQPLPLPEMLSQRPIFTSFER